MTTNERTIGSSSKSLNRAPQRLYHGGQTPLADLFPFAPSGMKLLHVVGARPNFPKLAPVYRAAEQAGLDQCVVHTGQHYDDALSASFFRDLSIRPPDVNLGVGSSSHAVQVAHIMERFEPVLRRYEPDWIAVYGDVNSTVAAALVASKLGVRVAHVEAGCGATIAECRRKSIVL